MSENGRLLLHALTIGGLKGFQDPQTIEFAPITLLFGPNSAGKSSIIQSLLLLKQTAEAPTAVTASLVTDGPWTDVGPYPELIHNHQVRNPLTIGIQASVNGAVHAVNPWNDDLLDKPVPSTTPWKYDRAGWQWRWTWDPEEQRATLADQLITIGDAPFMRLVPARDAWGPGEMTATSPDDALMVPYLASREHPLWEHWTDATRPYREAWVRAIDQVLVDLDRHPDEYIDGMLEWNDGPVWARTPSEPEPASAGPDGVQDVLRALGDGRRDAPPPPSPASVAVDAAVTQFWSTAGAGGESLLAVVAEVGRSWQRMHRSAAPLPSDPADLRRAHALAALLRGRGWPKGGGVVRWDGGWRAFSDRSAAFFDRLLPLVATEMLDQVRQYVDAQAEAAEPQPVTSRSPRVLTTLTELRTRLGTESGPYPPEEVQAVRRAVLEEVEAILRRWRTYCTAYAGMHARHDTFAWGWGDPDVDWDDVLRDIRPESFWLARARRPSPPPEIRSLRELRPYDPTVHPAPRSAADPARDFFGWTEEVPVAFNLHGAFVDEVSPPNEPRNGIRSENGSAGHQLLFGSEVSGRPMAPVPSLGAVGRDVSRSLAAFLRTRVTYVPPYRAPLPSLATSGAQPLDAPGLGGVALLAVLASQPERRGYLNAALKKLAVPYTAAAYLATQGLPEPVQVVRLEDTRTGVPVRPSGVGHGVGQVLPLLVESTRRDPTVIVVEQPELHLHPRLQAALGSSIAEAVQARGHQFIIETHSEHLVLRLQRLIRRNQLSATAVAVYYVDQEHVVNDAGAEDWISRVRRLRLDAGGDFIDEWPDGFFEEAYREMFGEDPS